MSEILEITKAQVDFRDERDWKQFHDTKNLAIALSMTVMVSLDRYTNGKKTMKKRQNIN